MGDPVDDFTAFLNIFEPDEESQKCCSCGSSYVCWDISMRIYEPVCELCYGVYLVLASRKVGQELKQHGMLIFRDEGEEGGGTPSLTM